MTASFEEERNVCKLRVREFLFLSFFLSLSLFSFLFFLFFLRAAPVAYGSSQARGRFRVAAASLHYSHYNTGSEPHL